jgi:centrin-3
LKVVTDKKKRKTDRERGELGADKKRVGAGAGAGAGAGGGGGEGGGGEGVGTISFRAFLDWWRGKGIEREFTACDADCSGALSRDELPALLRNLGLPSSEESTRNVWEALDTTHDGKIEFSEFTTGIRRWWGVFDAKVAFEKYDGDGSGRINMHELAAMLHDLGCILPAAELREVAAALDTDRDGQVSARLLTALF